jgi:hypothetical protein
MRLTNIEYSAGYGACYVASQREVTELAVVEKQFAVTTCARLAVELAQSDPIKAATLDAAARDETKTAYELYGLCKSDGRAPKPAGEAATKPTSGGVK